MTHTFRKGDTGLTRGGDEYEVLADDMGAYEPLAVRVRKYVDWTLFSYVAGGEFVPLVGEHPCDLMPPEPPQCFTCDRALRADESDPCDRCNDTAYYAAQAAEDR